jgi:TrmH family RNA methyltransferase
VPNYLSKNLLTTYRKLAQKKYRDRYRLFIIEGLRAVEQVIEGKKVKVEAIITSDNASFDLKPQNFDSFVVSSDDFKSLSDTQNAQGILAVCHIPEDSHLDLLLNDSGIIVAMDRIQDPGNLGTIIRSATWFNCAGLILGEGTVDYFNPKVVRSTAGAVGVLPYVNGPLSESLTQLFANGWQIVFLDASDKAIPIKSLTKSNKTVIVVGNEASGINSDLYNSEYVNVFISGDNQHVESLNASVALSISLFHLFTN